ncbi:MAG: DUF1289 domain-containing protein [Alphaproteobacteria bacterium]
MIPRPPPLPRIKSPCVKVCRLDSNTQFCEGCGRTSDEVARWIRMTEAERDAILATLPQRLVSIR